MWPVEWSVGGAREQRTERRCVWGCFNCRTHGRSHSEGDGHQPGGGEGGSSVDLSEETSTHWEAESIDTWGGSKEEARWPVGREEKRRWKWTHSVVSDSLGPAGFSVHGILRARVLEWVAIFFSRGSSRPRDLTWVSRIAGRRFTLWDTREALKRRWEGTKEQRSDGCYVSHWRTVGVPVRPSILTVLTEDTKGDPSRPVSWALLGLLFFSLISFFFFLPSPHAVICRILMQGNLISPTRDQTHVPCHRRVVS